MSRYEETNCE
jgi:hypothetical protein